MDHIVNKNLEKAFKVEQNQVKYDALLLEYKEAVLSLNVWKKDDKSRTINSPILNRINNARVACTNFLDDLAGANDSEWDWYKQSSIRHHTQKMVVKEYMKYYEQWVTEQVEPIGENDAPILPKAL